MINFNNNLIFVCIHFAISFIYWYFGESYVMKYYYITIITLIFYIGISCLLSGKTIRIGNYKNNICSVLFIPILLSLIWLLCIIEDDGSFLSNLVWVIYLYALGPFWVFIEMFLSGENINLVEKIVYLVTALIPSIFFWVGIEIKSFYLRKHTRSSLRLP